MSHLAWILEPISIQKLDLLERLSSSVIRVIIVPTIPHRKASRTSSIRIGSDYWDGSCSLVDKLP